MKYKIDLLILVFAAVVATSLLSFLIIRDFLPSEKECKERHVSTDIIMEWQSPDKNNMAIYPMVLIPERLMDSFKFVYKVEPVSNYTRGVGDYSGTYIDQGKYIFGLNVDTIK
jgi:hypothetical protein